MISIYEAVAQKPVPPVQATGAVVPQQQQPQPVQVPAQPAALAQQPSVNASLSVPAVNPAEQQIAIPSALTEPSWKKPLKIAALIGAGIGGGALLHGIYNNGFGGLGLSSGASTFGNFFGGDENGEVENDGSTTESTGKPRRFAQGNISRSGRDILSSPSTAPMKGPLSSPNADPASYGQHWPQPGNAPKTLGSDVHQGYSYRGGRSYLFGSMLPADEVTSTQSAPYATNVSTGGSYNGRYHQPFNERDFGLSSGMRN